MAHHPHATLVFKVKGDEPLGMKIDHPSADKSHYPAVITQVSAGKQAAVAGVKPGMHIHAVNNKDCIDKKLKWVVKLIKKTKSAGEPLSLTLVQDDPPADIVVDDPDGIPHTISNWTLSRASMAGPEDGVEDEYVELIAPDQTIVDWPSRAMPKGVPAGSKLRFEVSVLAGPQRTQDTTVTFDKGKLGLGLDQVRFFYLNLTCFSCSSPFCSACMQHHRCADALKLNITDILMPVPCFSLTHVNN